jgi:phosphoribosylformylglycinamidine cyclo-ligase
LFDWLRTAGGIDEAEMLRTFNCGIGLTVVVAAADAAAAMAHLTACGETVWQIGDIIERAPDMDAVQYL